MALRHRQISVFFLPREGAALLTAAGTLLVWFLSKNFWLPLFGIPGEFHNFIAYTGCMLYLVSCAGRVPEGKERAQLFFGAYTGGSFRAGIYLLPKLPFPIISLILRGLLSVDISSYLGWVLEGDVYVESITIKIQAEGMTNDGVRVSTSGTLILEIENAAVYLSQTQTSSGRGGLHEAVSSQCSARIKQRVIAKHSARELMQADYQDEYGAFNRWVTEVCDFIKEFGLSLAQSPIVHVTIESDRIREAFDATNAKLILRDNTNEVAAAFKEFTEGLPKGTSEEVALLLFNHARIDEGLPPVNIVKLK